jgi:hypothetical protein
MWMLKRFFIGISLLALCHGCTHSLQPRESPAAAGSESFKLFSGEYQNTSAMKNNPPTSLAVLPFTGEPENWTMELEREDPAAIVRRGFYGQVSALPFRDQELFETDSRLAAAGLTTPDSVAAMLDNDPGALAEVLGVDAAVTGEVTHFDRVFAGLGSQVAVGCEVRMVELPSGRLLWRAKHVSRGFAGGVSVSPVGLAVNALASLWNLRQVELYRQTDNLFREMTGTIHVPDAPKVPTSSRPKIAFFTPLAHDTPYKAGDKVVFRLVAEPGGTAYARITEVDEPIRLEPVQQAVEKALRGQIIEEARKLQTGTGLPFPQEAEEELRRELKSLQVYEGAYMVPEGLELRSAQASATLVGESGGTTRAAWPGEILIDGKPPQAPENLSARPLSGKVELTWKGIEVEDLAGYEVWKSLRPISGYERARFIEAERVLISDLPNFTPHHFKVRALDRVGNAGQFTTPAEATPAPERGMLDLPSPGPLLTGVLEKGAYLTAEKGPYRIEGELLVPEGVKLVIGPGAELTFGSGAGLLVKGRLLVYGEPERPVSFMPSSRQAKCGSYLGVFLDGSERAIILNTLISGAKTGLRIRESAPELTAVTVTDSSQAGLHLMDGASPTITCSTISGNTGMGGIVLEGTGLSPKVGKTVFRDNSAYDVQSFGPIRLDMSGNYWAGSRPLGERALGNINLLPALDRKPENCP